MSDLPWTVGRMLQWTTQYFNDHGIETGRLDAEVLLSHMLGKDRIYCYSHYDQPLTSEELAAFKRIVLRRVKGSSVATITGYKEFMGLKFYVNDHVLIPRPDTETLVEGVLALCDNEKEKKYSILDLCTGTGAILFSLLHYLPKAIGVGVDISELALAIASKNRDYLGLSERVTLVESDLFSAVPIEAYDLITANPPYICSKDIPNLTKEVLQEPLIALDGGDDGLAFYKKIIPQSIPYLKQEGFLVLEIGEGQETDVISIATTASLRLWGCWKDVSGIVRTVVLQK